MLKKVTDWIENEATDVELIDVVNSINSWNGELEDYKFFYMDELDDIFYGIKPTELLSRLADDFNANVEGFKDTIYGLESCSMDDIATDIRNNAEEIAEAIIDNVEHIDIPDSLQEILEEE